MRTPRKPRKPMPLDPSAVVERTSGGETSARDLPDYTQDYVPTAPVDPQDFADLDIDESDESYNYGDTTEEAGYLEISVQNDHDLVDRADEPIELSQRRLERRAEQRRIQFKRFAIFSGSIIASTVLIWLIFFSSIMTYSFQDTDIRGLSAESIVDRARLADVLRAHNGEQILLFDDQKLQAEVSQVLPEIAKISSEYQFPNKLVFNVVERVAVACVVSGEQCQAIAQDGTRIAVPQDRVASLIKIGELPEELDQEIAMDSMTTVLNSLNEALRAIVGQISIDRNMLISLTLSDGRNVVWGQAEHNEQKAGILAVLVNQPVSRIDVSAPNAPVTS
ncbi:FtsQ-type POTRA domain-containing protein [Arcanobacterium phocisimile]|uniref:FtsQ-type POTRA domain-containing protein n=1 Tax=Arcanobacterium phocisimile TaxID=1302235 RepID=A0ABX7IIG0_9ACTO|nr:FtsQ-type POTRA domain-containing protein [Arcanobacterium phocisimile]QRV02776.1 FtsQ-type POTRA domain-containing protein [Arcanobacterium phocisimile]